MDIKSILKDNNFIQLMNSVNKINIDVFENYKINKAYGVQTSTLRINYDKAISNQNLYDDSFKFYQQANKFLKDLYSSYSTEFLTYDEFVVALFDKLKNYVVLNNVLPSNNIKQKRVLNPIEIKDYQNRKDEYIRLILTQGIPDLNNLSAVKVLENIDLERFADFFDKVENEVNTIMTINSYDVNNKNQRLTILKEYLTVLLPESFRNGDDLVTQKIDINKIRFDGFDVKYKDTPTHLKTLAFLENHILLSELGYLKNNVGFDGFRFFDTISGKSINLNTKNLHKTKLSGAERLAQSNFVLDENFAAALLSMPKKFMKIRNKNCIKSTAIVDGDTIETVKVMYRKKFQTHDSVRDGLFNDHLKIGYFCKVKEFNKTKGTYSFMLYYFPDQDANQAIQLFRIDKVEDMFKGAPASHNLRGKEKIVNTLHTHTYNLIDAVLKNHTKQESLGKMDLSHIFPTADAFDSKIIEEYFDCFCGIHGNYLRKVNQKKFAKFFNKYQPIEYGMD